ncbi:MAG TPA: FAD-dependent oxidoreductase [Candidatus Omnitrophota bacterium]|nr:FAD-dependent oxidoreductase [Candidatus Omnitrophota bacterium]
MSQEYTLKIINIITRVTGVKSFRLERPEGFSFKPGQWMFVHLDVNGKEEKKPLSFSSSPTETGYIEFTKRLTGSDFSKKLDSLKEGDNIKIKMPYGNFTFEGELPKIALLSGGIGITPFRSVCKNATDKKLDTDIMLLYSNSVPEGIIFKDEFDEMLTLNPKLKVVHTITSPDAHKLGWKGCSGTITGAMVKKEIPDYMERVFFLCGPPGMVECLIEMLKLELKVPDSNIRKENFMGYA